MVRAPLLVTLTCVLATPAFADLPVTYDTNYKALKERLLFGDPLGFSLYDNPACAGEPVYSEILGAGAPPVTVELPRRCPRWRPARAEQRGHRLRPEAPQSNTR
jgi:hypothetical protein